MTRAPPQLWGQDGPRGIAVTPDEPSRALRSFITTRLEHFGPWQDAMVGGEPVLFHSLLSAPMDLGVLEPLRAIRAAERAYRRDAAPIQSAEGFVRQTLGWREYMWGTYWLRRGYAHHIPRLMVLGNAMALAGRRAVAGGPLVSGRVRGRRRVGNGLVDLPNDRVDAVPR